MSLWAVLLAGGQGTRLWPMTGAARPKPLADPLGEGVTLLEAALARLDGLVPPERVLLVCSVGSASAIRAALPGFPRANLLVEPSGRDTFAAALWGTAVAEGRGATEVLVAPTDHVVADVRAFRGDVRAGLGWAQAGALVLFGQEAAEPSEAYGYIVPAGVLDADASAPVGRFVEKPAAALAAALIAEGACWNAGVFLWSVSAFVGMLAQADASFPAHYVALRAGGAAVDVGQWEAVPKGPLDRQLCERVVSRLRVIVGRWRWSDLGTWPAVIARWPDQDGVQGRSLGLIAVEATGLAVWAPGHQVLVAGLDDVLVVVTGQGVLVAHRDALPGCGRAAAGFVQAKLDEEVP